ncbi:hypothetical protein BH24CHL9_BH24CHL9_16720 [soil metagenome]
MSEPGKRISEGVSIEGVYLVEAEYTPEAGERRPAVRGAHITRLAALKREGTLVEAGAYSDRLTSSLLILRVGSEDEALAIAREDIYVASGVWGDIRARPFGRVAVDGDGDG